MGRPRARFQPTWPYNSTRHLTAFESKVDMSSAAPFAQSVDRALFGAGAIAEYGFHSLRVQLPALMTDRRRFLSAWHKSSSAQLSRRNR